MRYRNKVIGLCFFLFILQGCAVLLDEPTQPVAIISKPGQAVLTIVDESGREIYSGQTPSIITLKKGTGHYFGDKTYFVKITKPGYKTKVIPVVSMPNNYYLFGNIFWSFLGWFLVDPFYPNMYDLVPPNIDATLEKQDLN